MFSQLHCDGGVLLDLPLRLAFEQLKAEEVSKREEGVRAVTAYCSVGVVEEILQGVVGFPKCLLEDFCQCRHGGMVVVRV